MPVKCCNNWQFAPLTHLNWFENCVDPRIATVQFHEFSTNREKFWIFISNTLSTSVQPEAERERARKHEVSVYFESDASTKLTRWN